MNKNIKKVLYYLIILLLFIVFDKVLLLIPSNNYNDTINNLLLLENNDLKKELYDITKLNYDDYDYEIGKITYQNLYNTNSYFVEYNNSFNNNIVLNDKGMIGIVNNHVLTLVKDLSLSVRIENNYGILKENKIVIINGDYEIGMPIYTSDKSSINDEYLIGYIKDINSNDIESIMTIDYLNITSSYVAILKQKKY